MDQEEFRRMGELEESLWWYHGLHANVLHALKVYASGSSDLLDAGCGTGGVLKAIRDLDPRIRLHGLDLSPIACEMAREKSGATVTVGSVAAMGLPDRSFDVVISLDVMGYAIDREAALRGFFEVLRPGGRVVLNLPSYQWMLSYHDRAVGQSKRFTLREGIGMLEKQGFKVLSASYWNTVLFPLMVIRRKLLPGSSTSDVKPIHPVMNGLFDRCLAFERLFTERRIRLPFGGSMFFIAERPTE